MSKAFPVNFITKEKFVDLRETDLLEISKSFNSEEKTSPFENTGVMIDGKVYDIAQSVETFVPTDNVAGAFAISPTKYGHVVNVFFSFIPMIFHEPDDKVLVEWTIIKEIT